MAEKKIEYECTISPDLLATWQKLRRRNDPEAIAKAVGKSRPIIDRALLYGHVKIEGLTSAISKFFSDRLQDEKKQSATLEKLTQ